MIHRNGRRLLNLVNRSHCLDFQPYGSAQELRLQPRSGRYYSVRQGAFLAFSDVAERKKIQLDFESNRSNLITKL